MPAGDPKGLPYPASASKCSISGEGSPVGMPCRHALDL
jgi:hypothetical protein